MTSRSHQCDSIEALDTWLSSVVSDDFVPTLAIAFMGVKFDIASVQKTFRKHDVALFGASSWGEFTEGDIQDGTIAVLLLDLDAGSFDIRLDHFEGGDEASVTTGVAKYAQEQFDNPFFMVLTANLQTDMEAVLKVFESTIGPKVELAGA